MVFSWPLVYTPWPFDSNSLTLCVTSVARWAASERSLVKLKEGALKAKRLDGLEGKGPVPPSDLAAYTSEAHGAIFRIGTVTPHKSRLMIWSPICCHNISYSQWNTSEGPAYRRSFSSLLYLVNSTLTFVLLTPDCTWGGLDSQDTISGFSLHNQGFVTVMAVYQVICLIFSYLIILM